MNIQINKQLSPMFNIYQKHKILGYSASVLVLIGLASLVWVQWNVSITGELFVLMSIITAKGYHAWIILRLSNIQVY